MALSGERREAGLVRFTPAGILAEWPPQQVIAIDLTAHQQRRGFRRGRGGTWIGDAGAVSDSVAERIDVALRLLHNSAPQRTDLEPGNLAEFQLAPPAISVTVQIEGGAAVTIDFGAINPLGLERYARIAGREKVMLLPSFVAEPWEAIAASP